jgi:hypothetical protein
MRARSQRTMQSLKLQAAMSELVEAAAGRLGSLLVAGAEVPFELESQRTRRGSSAPTLYCYRALTGEFIAEHRSELERLPSYGEAARALEGFDGLARYLASVGAEPARADMRSRVRAAILALLSEVFEEQTDFELRPERLRGALDRLERSALAGVGQQTTLIATLHGLTISSSELALTSGLTIAQPHVLEGLPEAALAPEQAGAHEHLIIALVADEDDPREAIARGREVLKDLLRALRLFGDGRVTLGALAWARVAGGRWTALALGAGGRPHGMLVVGAEQEDELRAFCNLVSRRAPHDNELAWALRRFELGCERESPLEALSDHLLALRALLEPEGPASGLLPGRLAALCATPERRPELTEWALAALALEREAIAGTAAPHAGPQALARDMADHLRALLRDVICGHLDHNLVGLADQLLLERAHELAAAARELEQSAHELAAPTPAQIAFVPDAIPTELSSVEQILGDPSQSQEILDVFI